MEFKEIQDIWQHQELQKEIKTNVMDTDVLKLNRKSHFTAQKNEKWIIGIFAFTGVMTLIDSIVERDNWQAFLETILILFIPVTIYLLRRKRLRRNLDFDSSLIGNLDQAINNTKSTILLARILLWGLVVPLEVLHFIKYWKADSFFLKEIVVLVMFSISIALISWELTCVHSPKKKELLALRQSILAH